MDSSPESGLRFRVNTSEAVFLSFEPPHDQTPAAPFATVPPWPPVDLPLDRTPGQRLQQAFDILAATLLLIFLLPLYLVLALAIKLDSPGPVLFTQTRVGRGGAEFPFYKFRSMVADAEAQRQALERRNERSGPVFKMKDDPRVTRVGRLLRKLSLDELPQLLNVLKGDMSLVGPRPALPAEVARYSDHQRRRLSVTPGLTGLWQVSGRAGLSFERSVELDLLYIDSQSLWLNLVIVARTIPAVLKGDGAY